MNFRSASRCGLFFLCGAITLTAIGCAPSGSAQVSLDENTAKESLTTFLDTWKSGGTSASLQEKDPKIYGSDFDWDNGLKLISYEFDQDTLNDGANLQTQVNLTLQDGEGTETVVLAKYTITTEPEITVIRSDEDAETSD